MTREAIAEIYNTEGNDASMNRPNVVYILADDLGWNDLGASGSTFYESPHIDRIATEGMRFTKAYATCQVCSPSRASIMTGKYAPRHGITDYLGAKFGEEWRELGRHDRMLPADNGEGIGSDEIVFPKVMRDAGYRTFFAGKWHLGGPGAYPEDFGFEINKGGWDAGGPAGGYFSPWTNPKLEPGPAGECLPLRLARETVEFIDAAKNEPFLVYLSFYSVHGPIQTSRDRWEKYRQKAVAQGVPETRFIFDGKLPVRQVQDCPIYAGMIETMDDAVGMVLEALDRNGMTENTMVCFTSDNGGVSAGDSFSSSMLPLRGGKGRQWEGGIREPLYIRFPSRVEAGSVCDTPVSGIDFYPTLLECAGLEVPTEQRIDGRSMVQLLSGGKDAAFTERDLFWHYPHYGNQGGGIHRRLSCGSHGNSYTTTRMVIASSTILTLTSANRMMLQASDQRWLPNYGSAWMSGWKRWMLSSPRQILSLIQRSGQRLCGDCKRSGWQNSNLSTPNTLVPTGSPTTTGGAVRSLPTDTDLRNDRKRQQRHTTKGAWSMKKKTELYPRRRMNLTQVV